MMCSNVTDFILVATSTARTPLSAIVGKARHKSGMPFSVILARSVLLVHLSLSELPVSFCVHFL